MPPHSQQSDRSEHNVPLSKQDVADLLDLHYMKLTKHIETCLENLNLSHTTPSMSDDPGGALSTPGWPICSACSPTEAPLDVLSEDMPRDVPRNPAVVSLDMLLEGTPMDVTDHIVVNLSSMSFSVDASATGFLDPPVPFEQRRSEVDSNVSLDIRGKTGAILEVDELPTYKSALSRLSHRTPHIQSLIKELRFVQRSSASKKFWRGLSALLSIFNAILVGIRIECERGETDSNSGIHDFLNIGSLVVCVFFVCELVLGVLVQKVEFFMGREYMWNGLEITICLSMILDEIFRRSGAKFTGHLCITWVSACRIIILLKPRDALQSKPLWREMQSLVCFLGRCYTVVVWPMGIMLLMTYLFALALTQRAATICFSDSFSKDLCKYFGGLDTSMFSILAAVLGGLPWGVLYDELRNMGVFYIVIFVLFVAVISQVVVNTLLSAVVELYRELAISQAGDAISRQMRRQKEFTEKAISVFEAIDSDFDGIVSKDEFRLALCNAQLTALLDSMNLQVYDIDAAFEIFDTDSSGSIDVNELIEGLFRTSGSARGIDLFKLAGQVDRMNQMLGKVGRSLEDGDENAGLFAVGPSPSIGGHSRPLAGHVRSADSGQQNFGLRTQLLDMHKANRGSTSRISQVQKRAMSLEELRVVRRTVELLSEDEHWVDTPTQAPLVPADVNLYHFNHYFISPVTLPSGVVFRDVVDVDFYLGQAVIQRDDEGIVQARGEITEIFGGDSFRLSVTTGCFNRMVPILIDDEPRPNFRMDIPVHLSYKELVASTPMIPLWFCSHWWGESVLDFVACIERHLKIHEFQEKSTGYWICAYANDQHDLSLDIGEEVQNSSFFKAMALSSGVLVILDPHATAFSRIWCDFEIYKAIQDEKELDIVTVRKRTGTNAHEPRMCLLTQNRCPGETSHHKKQREMFFPSEILCHGMTVQLENGHASRQSDKEAILHIMAKGDPSLSPDFDTTLKLALKKANTTLHSYFALAAWPAAVKRKSVADFDRKLPGTLSLPDILVQDESRKSLALDFSSLEVLCDRDIELLAQGFPPNLESLDLAFNSCDLITDTGLKHLAESLKDRLSLHRVTLNFSSCVRITDKGVLALANALPRGLRELHLHFLACRKISPLSGQAIATNIRDSIIFSATFRGSLLNQDFGSLKDFKRWLKTTDRRDQSEWVPASKSFRVSSQK